MLGLRRINIQFGKRILTRNRSDGIKPAVNPDPPQFGNDPTIAKSSTSQSTFSDVKQDVDLSKLYVKVGQVEGIQSISESIFKTAAPFDEVPGPPFLKSLAKFWSFVPVVGTQVTASTVQYLLSAGSQLSWGNNLWLFKYLLDEYGPVVRLHGPFGGDVVIVSRPEHASMVFQNEGPYPIRATLDCVEKYRLQYRKYKHSGPFLMYGPEWEKLRKSIEEPLSSALTIQYDKLDKTCLELVDRIVSIRNKQQEVPKEFLNEIHKWSLECLFAVMFNRRIGFLDVRGLSTTSEPGIVLESLTGATNAIRKCESGFHLWKFFETPSWKSLKVHCDTIDNVLTKYIRKAQDKLREKKNIGVDLRPEEMSLMEYVLLKESIVPDDMQTILLDMMLIGVNTTSHAIAFLLYHLARYPRAQQKLFDEIKDLPMQIDRDTLNSLQYMKACIKESLRLQPPMPILNRILTKDILVHGYKIPKGTYMLIATKLSSLREEHFEDAVKFKPERWSQIDAKDMECMATIPYGYGAKACLAKELAEVQVGLLLFKILKQFRIEYHYGDIQSSNNLIASPNRPLQFRFVDRI
ncbi:probable cytochrome P450 301a1, mitochondrial isoform X2 [Onthophagus taurus]|uniref:probable cytochrome P450 301a1, mitochondrial isoform X2 n=1 Tax=Onthophagus taurus TaxID=166361 RepID=UPI000C20670E|nr:probable cytochrome P450 301a1, mitochondrial isoform X2 [Onthophagus taurus]